MRQEREALSREMNPAVNSEGALFYCRFFKTTEERQQHEGKERSVLRENKVAVEPELTKMHYHSCTQGYHYRLGGEK